MDKVKKSRLRDAIIFFVCIVLHFINHLYGEYLKVPVISYILNCYFNDFLGGIAFIGYVNFTLSFYEKGPVRICSYFQVIMLSCLCSFCWEYIAPLLKESTADWWDCLAYTLGATGYWILDTNVRINNGHTE